jgi:type I restriction enzyme S subunit
MGERDIWDTQDHITEDAVKASATQVVPEGTVLMVARSGILARTLPISIARVRVALNQDMKAMLARPGLHYAFLAYFLETRSVDILGRCVKRGATVHSLDTGKIEQLQVPLPPLSEQRRIVEILDQADALRKLRAAADAKAERILPALFYKMFGDPATNSMGWPTKHLGDVSTIRRGASPRPIDLFMGGTVPWIRIGDATGDTDLYIEKTVEFVTEEGARRSVFVQPGTLLVANSGVSCGFARITRIGGCIHDGWLAIEKLPRELSPLFLAQLINLQTLRLRALAPSGTQPNLNTDIMRRLSVPLAPAGLVDSYSRIAEAVRCLGVPRVLRRKKIQLLFDTLLHRAFSGDLTAKWREAHMQELLAEMEQQAKSLESSRSRPLLDFPDDRAS